MKSFYLILGFVLIGISLALEAEGAVVDTEHGKKDHGHYIPVHLLAPEDSSTVAHKQPVTFYWTSTHLDTSAEPSSLSVEDADDEWLADEDPAWEELDPDAFAEGSDDANAPAETLDPRKHKRPFTYTLYIWGHKAHIKVSKLTDTSYVLTKVKKLEKGKTYKWRVAVKPKKPKGKRVYSAEKFRFTVEKIIAGSSEAGYEPSEFRLGQNYPNPFNPTTTLTFNLPVASSVTLVVSNILGQTIKEFYRDAALKPGMVEVNFDAAGLPSGIYFCRMRAEGQDGRSFNEMRKMLLTR